MKREYTVSFACTDDVELLVTYSVIHVSRYYAEPGNPATEVDSTEEVEVKTIELDINGKIIDLKDRMTKRIEEFLIEKYFTITI